MLPAYLFLQCPKWAPLRQRMRRPNLYDIVDKILCDHQFAAENGGAFGEGLLAKATSRRIYFMPQSRAGISRSGGCSIARRMRAATVSHVSGCGAALYLAQTTQA